MNLKPLFSAITFLSAASCTSTPKPELVAELNALEGRSTTTTAQPAQQTYKPQPIRPGQWVQHLITAEDGSKQSFKQQILEGGPAPSSFWMETEILTPTHKTISKSLVSVNSSAVKTTSGRQEFFLKDLVNVERIQTWNTENQEAEEIPPELVKMVGSSMANTQVISEAQFSGARNAKVRAGFFQGCFDMKSKGRMAIFSGEFNGCLHSAVPLSGIVVGQDNRGNNWELIGYGQTGAKPLLTAPVRKP
jgi:hypothetical protein